MGYNVSFMNESIMAEMTYEMISNIEIYEMICEMNHILKYSIHDSFHISFYPLMNNAQNSMKNCLIVY